MSFFKQDGVVVDVEEGKLYLSEGKVMQLDFVNMTVKDFSNRSKLLPIRFSDENKLLFWGANSWRKIELMYSTSIVKAIYKLVEIKVEQTILD